MLDSEWWRRIEQRIADLPESARAAARALPGPRPRGARRRSATRPWPFGTWHGDLARWNAVEQRRRSFVVWDWERATGPGAGRLRRGPRALPAAAPDATAAPARSPRRSRSPAPARSSPSSGYDGDVRTRVVTAYLLELRLRLAEDETMGSLGDGQWFADAVTEAALEWKPMTSRRPHRTAGPHEPPRAAPLPRVPGGAAHAPVERAADRVAPALPDFLIVGGQRCGTTSLYRYLDAAPVGAVPAPDQGHALVRRGVPPLRGLVPVELPAREGPPSARQRDRWPGLVGEACPYYLFHPEVPGPHRPSTSPTPRSIAILRDPVARAWSAYHHEYRRGYETLGVRGGPRRRGGPPRRRRARSSPRARPATSPTSTTATSRAAATPSSSSACGPTSTATAASCSTPRTSSATPTP